MTQDSRFPSWISNAFVLVLTGVVAYVMYALVMENRELRAQLAAFGTTSVDDLAPGDPLPRLGLRSLEGTEASLPGLAGGGGVVAFLTTTCPFCEQTLPAWRTVAEASARRGVPFVGVSFHELEPTRAYVTERGITWPLWVADGAASADTARVHSVPFTVLIDSAGGVVRAWQGPLAPADVDALIAALDGEISEASLIPGSPANDPGCCEAPVPGTGTER